MYSLIVFANIILNCWEFSKEELLHEMFNPGFTNIELYYLINIIIKLAF